MQNLKLTSSYASDLKNDPIVSNWFLSIDASVNTQRNYLQATKAFCEFTENSEKPEYINFQEKQLLILLCFCIASARQVGSNEFKLQILENPVCSTLLVCQ
jgi:hypothetical protein